jgi:hypothetical protein
MGDIGQVFVDYQASIDPGCLVTCSPDGVGDATAS